MKRAILAILVLAVIASAAIIATIRVPTAQAADCSWGALKCCFADPPCYNACCPRPKDDG